MRIAHSTSDMSFAVLSCLLAGSGLWMKSAAPTLLRHLSREDGPLEWATFWAFAAAAVTFLIALRGSPASSGWRTVYLVCLAIGSLAIALEEISWGQRLFAYQPPEVFLQANTQQEFNLHNLTSTGVRKFVLFALMIGFGVLWPLLARTTRLNQWLKQRFVHAPSLWILPGFALAAGLYAAYPWHNTGEWVELLAGLGFLAVAGEQLEHCSPARPNPGALLLAASLAAGAVTPLAVPAHNAVHKVAAATAEAEALAADFRSKRLRSRCGVHKRLSSFVDEYGAKRMDHGDWAAVVGGVPSQSVRYRNYLDPWNMPYWIRHSCSSDKKQRAVFVYSFGPDLRRDSSAWQIEGDDIGYYVHLVQ